MATTLSILNFYKPFMSFLDKRNILEIDGDYERVKKNLSELETKAIDTKIELKQNLENFPNINKEVDEVNKTIEKKEQELQKSRDEFISAFNKDFENKSFKNKKIKKIRIENEKTRKK